MPKGKFDENLIYGPCGPFPFPTEDEGAAWALEHGVNDCPDAPDNAIYIGWVSAPMVFVSRVAPSEPSFVSPKTGALDEHALDEVALDMDSEETNAGGSSGPYFDSTAVTFDSTAITFDSF